MEEPQRDRTGTVGEPCRAASGGGGYATSASSTTALDERFLARQRDRRSARSPCGLRSAAAAGRAGRRSCARRAWRGARPPSGRHPLGSRPDRSKSVVGCAAIPLPAARGRECRRLSTAAPRGSCATPIVDARRIRLLAVLRHDVVDDGEVRRGRSGRWSLARHSRASRRRLPRPPTRLSNTCAISARMSPFTSSIVVGFERDLARQVDRAAHADRLAVRPDRGRRSSRVNRFFRSCCFLRCHSAGAARHAHDARYRADAADHLRELTAVADFQAESERRRVAFGVDAHVLDVGVRGGDPARDLGEQADAVERADLDLGVELALDGLRPVDRNPLRGLLAVLGEIAAVSRWITMPRPLDMKPMISSPGIG